MSVKKTVDGLVLREVSIGDNDKLLTVLTAEEGQITLMAKGARSMKSKVLPLCRLFTYANFEYYERSEYRWVSGGSVNECFYSISSDMTGFALASYVVQLAAEIIMDKFLTALIGTGAGHGVIARRQKTALFGTVIQLKLQHGKDIFFYPFIINGEHHLDTAVKVAGHPIGT